MQELLRTAQGLALRSLCVVRNCLNHQRDAQGVETIDLRAVALEHKSHAALEGPVLAKCMKFLEKPWLKKSWPRFCLYQNR